VEKDFTREARALAEFIEFCGENDNKVTMKMVVDALKGRKLAKQFNGLD
jgi:hypothetical protein